VDIDVDVDVIAPVIVAALGVTWRKAVQPSE
jgi:hypothetical protein